MLSALLLELLRVLAIHMRDVELLELLGQVRLELELRGDRCAANYLARALSAHAAFVAARAADAEPGTTSPGDSGAVT